MATLVKDTVCATYSGLSKVYRACGYRVGWVSLSGQIDAADDYLHALDLLASLRLCANVPGQWAVQTALGGYQSINELTRPGGRLYESRAAVLEEVGNSSFLSVVAPSGSMYAFICVDESRLPGFDDHAFALELLEHQHVLLAPGSSFNVSYKNHFRITLLPRAERMREIFARIDRQLVSYADKLPNLNLQSTKTIDSGV